MPHVHEYITYFKSFNKSIMRSLAYNDKKFYYSCVYNYGFDDFSKKLHIFLSLSDYIKIESEVIDDLCFPLLHIRGTNFTFSDKFYDINSYIFSNFYKKNIIYLDSLSNTMQAYDKTHKNTFFRLDTDYLERISEDWDFDYIVNSCKIENFATGDYVRILQK